MLYDDLRQECAVRCAVTTTEAYAVAVDLMRQWRRGSRHGRALTLLPLEDQKIAREDPNLENVECSIDLGLMVQRACLSVPMIKVLWLLYVADMRQLEAARVLDISESRVSQLKCQALGRLRVVA